MINKYWLNKWADEQMNEWMDNKPDKYLFYVPSINSLKMYEVGLIIINAIL